MKIKLEKGLLEISPEVLSAICGNAANRCLWVKNMAPASAADSIAGMFGIGKLYRGVRVTEHEDGIDIELHIRIKHGMNISAVCSSIIDEVRYTVEDATGIRVLNVNVCVDGLVND